MAAIISYRVNLATPPPTVFLTLLPRRWPPPPLRTPPPPLLWPPQVRPSGPARRPPVAEAAPLLPHRPAAGPPAAPPTFSMADRSRHQSEVDLPNPNL
jgi:hypothetical protein